MTHRSTPRRFTGTPPTRALRLGGSGHPPSCTGDSWMALQRPAGILGLSMFTSQSQQTECRFQAIVDLLQRGRGKATDHLMDPRLLACDQIIARHERIVQQAGMLAFDSGRLDQQVGRLARSCEVCRDLGQYRGRHPRIVGIVLHDETRAPLAA